MDINLRDRIIELLKTQQEVFGNDFYETLEYTSAAAKNVEVKKEIVDTMPRKKVETAQSAPKVNPIPISTQAIEVSGCSDLSGLKSAIINCRSCPLGEGRNQFVFGEGNEKAKVMLIGEGPGAEEDATGRPFVGRAGQLLTDILKAIDFAREDVFIANVVKCRPPMNRKPFPNEMATCLNYLNKQIDIIKPGYILLLGGTAAEGVLGLTGKLGDMRGQTYEYKGAKVVVTYHPAALLRQQQWKKDCWEDVKRFRKLYDVSEGLPSKF